MELKNIVLVYEVAQIPIVLSYLREENILVKSCIIIPLEFEVEQKLKELKIPHVSLRTFVPVTEEFADVVSVARSTARQFHLHPSMAFYAYEGIHLGEVFEPMLDMYIEHLARYGSICKRILEGVSAQEIFIPHTTQQLAEGSGALVPQWFVSPVQAARMVAQHNKLPIRIIGDAGASQTRNTTTQLCAVRIGFRVYNLLMRLCIRPKPIKIFASEYWSHVKSFVEKMDDVEMVFMERSEIKNIPWKQLLKHRIRFLHPSEVASAKDKRIIFLIKSFAQSWHTAKTDISGLFEIVPGVNMWPAVEEALTILIQVYTQYALVDIIGLHYFLQKENPQKLLLRASIGGSAHHFFIATQVAHQLGIPSVELQHAGAVVDPRSVHSRLTASYLAAYGKITQEIAVKNFGYAPERIRVIGSPRFDHYVRERDALVKSRDTTLQELGLRPDRPTVFVAVPFAGAFPMVFSSYQVADFFNVFREAQKQISGLQIIFKFRPNGLSSFYKKLVQDLFLDGGVVMVDTSNFIPLIVACDVACTGKSTLLYEISLGETPMILYPWQRWDTYTRDVYARAAPVADSPEDLVKLLRLMLIKDEAEKAVAHQNRFLKENYSFDGHAPERMAALLREKLLPLP